MDMGGVVVTRVGRSTENTQARMCWLRRFVSMWSCTGVQIDSLYCCGLISDRAATAAGGRSRSTRLISGIPRTEQKWLATSMEAGEFVFTSTRISCGAIAVATEAWVKATRAPI